MKQITEKDRRLASICENCPACKHARKKQAGIIFQFVKSIEKHFCPFCRAYKKVHGKPAHQK